MKRESELIYQITRWLMIIFCTLLFFLVFYVGMIIASNQYEKQMENKIEIMMQEKFEAEKALKYYELKD